MSLLMASVSSSAQTVLKAGETLTPNENVFVFSRTEAESLFVKLGRVAELQESNDVLGRQIADLNGIIESYAELDSLRQLRFAAYDSLIVDYDRLLNLKKRRWHDITPVGVLVGALVVIGSSWVVANVNK